MLVFMVWLWTLIATVDIYIYLSAPEQSLQREFRRWEILISVGWVAYYCILRVLIDW